MDTRARKYWPRAGFPGYLRTMNWSSHFAARTRLMNRSAVRDLLAAASRPDLVSFAGGLPAPELFPVDALRAACDEVLTRHSAAALQYGETAGVPELRRWIAERCSRPGFVVEPGQVVITTGAQQALDLVGRVLLDPGDRVLVEDPTYLALLGAWRPLGVEFVTAPADTEGWLPDQLPGVGAGVGAGAGGPVPKLAYLIPNFRNPLGTSLSPGRRRTLLEWGRRQGVGVVEDDPYGELRDEGTPEIPSLLELDGAISVSGPGGARGAVIHCGTFSKVLAPGLRVGWIVAPEPVADRIVLAKQAADLHTGTFAQHVVLELLRRDVLAEQLPRLRTVYRTRRLALLEALARHLPEGTTWTRPAGGMFVFVTLPGEIEATRVLPAALERGVAFVPGEAFHVGNAGRNTLRLNFTHASPDRIELGVRRLAEAIGVTAPGRTIDSSRPALPRPSGVPSASAMNPV